MARVRNRLPYKRPEGFIMKRDIAHKLRVSEQAIARIVALPTFPAPAELPGQVWLFWPEDEVDAWIAEHYKPRRVARPLPPGVKPAGAAQETSTNA